MDTIEKQHIISNCPLCGDKSLHVLSLGDTENQQCISCGYVTSDGYKLNGDNYATTFATYWSCIFTALS